MTGLNHPGRIPTALVLLGLTFLARPVNAQILPPPAKVTPSARLFVREFRYSGNVAFSQAELAKVTAPYTNHAITSAELEEARRAVTVYYVNHGYINSGAILPDQEPTEGVVTIRIIEGSLTRINVHGNTWLRDGYITNRLQRWSKPPLNLNELKEGLQILRQDPNVIQVNAELQPGTAPGEGVLDLRMVDQQPFRVGMEVDNHRPPSVGAEEVSLTVADLNLTGHSDPLNLRYGIADSGADNGWGFSGSDNIAADYTLPITRFDTTVTLRGSRLNTALVEEPFTLLGIASETTTYGVELRQPLFQTPNREFALAVGFDRRQNDTALLGTPFNISPGAVNGRMVASVLRLSQEWTDRGPDHVLALRSTFNVGLGVLDATDDHIAGDPKANFFSWLGQAQYVRRLFNTQNQLILRATGQWTGDRLLALEQLSVGGAQTVRGYRENQLVRDRGVVSSIEFRVPVLFDKSGAGILHLAPFFDYGGAWDTGGSPSPTSIYSTGLGLLIRPNKHLEAQLYWGHRLHDVDNPHDNAQDLGLHFQVIVSLF